MTFKTLQIHRQYLSRGLYLILSIILVIGIYRQVSELEYRSKLGPGLTDESYGLLNAIDRGVNGQTTQTQLFADVSHILLSIADYDVRTYRIYGYMIILGITSLFVWKRAATFKSFEPSGKLIWFSLVIVFFMLLLPSGFRYLLVTPSYQWTILVGSVILSFCLSNYCKEEKRKFRPLVLIITALLVFIIELSRLTSGFATWVLVTIFLIKETRIRELITFNAVLMVFNALYLVFHHESFMTYLNRLVELGDIDPNGSNLIFETLEVSKTTITTLLVIMISSEIANRISVYLRGYSKTPKIISLKFISRIFLLAFLLFSFEYKDFSHLVAFFALISIGALIGVRGGIKNYSLLMLTAAPIVSQFGSNISSSYLVFPLVAHGILYISLFGASHSGKEYGERKTSDLLEHIFIFLLTASLILLQVNLSSTSYENGYRSSSISRDSITGLWYSSKKLDSIMKLRHEVANYGILEGDRILDLSYWHPGVIYYVEGVMFPVTTVNKFFRETLQYQIESTINQENVILEPYGTPILVETDSVEPNLKCRKLINQITDSDLIEVLKVVGFNPYIKEIAVYRSVKEDLTLYPKNIAIVLPCKPNETYRKRR